MNNRLLSQHGTVTYVSSFIDYCAYYQFHQWPLPPVPSMKTQTNGNNTSNFIYARVKNQHIARSSILHETALNISFFYTPWHSFEHMVISGRQSMNQLVGSFSGPSTSYLFTPYALLLFMTEVRSFHCRSKGWTLYPPVTLHFRRKVKRAYQSLGTCRLHRGGSFINEWEHGVTQNIISYTKEQIKVELPNQSAISPLLIYGTPELSL